jgi:hypothetical protein
MTAKSISASELATLIDALEKLVQGLKAIEVAAGPRGRVDIAVAGARLQHITPLLLGAEAMMARIATGNKLH